MKITIGELLVIWGVIIGSAGLLALLGSDGAKARFGSCLTVAIVFWICLGIAGARSK